MDARLMDARPLTVSASSDSLREHDNPAVNRTGRTCAMSEELNHLIERFKRASDSRLFAPLADAYRKNGDIDAAVALLESGIERFPAYASARVILGKCYYDKGATERAKEEFLNVLKLDGENMVALKYLGDILLAEDKRSEAARYYRRLLGVDATNEEVAGILKELEASLPLREIDLADAKTVRDERPRDLATMTLAGIYAAQGYYGKALRIYREILEREPGNREALDMVAKLGSIMSSNEAERGEAFREQVLTISLDDVSEGLVSSTSGHGGGPCEAHGGGESREENARDAAADMPGLADSESGERERAAMDEAPSQSSAVTPPGHAEGSSSEAGSGPAESLLADRDMDNFREWLKRMREKQES